MREVSSKGIRHLAPKDEDVIYDPPGCLGDTQERFLSMAWPSIPLAKGVYRFKTHEEMNAQRDAVENEIVRLQQGGNLRDE